MTQEMLFSIEELEPLFVALQTQDPDRLENALGQVIETSASKKFDFSQFQAGLEQNGIRLSPAMNEWLLSRYMQ